MNVICTQREHAIRGRDGKSAIRQGEEGVQSVGDGFQADSEGPQLGFLCAAFNTLCSVATI